MVGEGTGSAPSLASVEARRVAERATQALKASRERVAERPGIGTPTWTGRHGAAGAPRFGGVENPLLLAARRRAVAGSRTTDASASGEQTFFSAARREAAADTPPLPPP